MSEMRELQRQYAAISAEQGRLNKELAISFNGILELMNKAAVGRSQEEYLQYCIQVSTNTTRALRSYVAVITAILDRLEEETKDE